MHVFCCFNLQQKGAMTVTKVVTVVKTKKGPHTHKKKGELMENDQDAMEVSFLFVAPNNVLLFCHQLKVILYQSNMSPLSNLNFNMISCCFMNKVEILI